MCTRCSSTYSWVKPPVLAWGAPRSQAQGHHRDSPAACDPSILQHLCEAHHDPSPGPAAPVSCSRDSSAPGSPLPASSANPASLQGEWQADPEATTQDSRTPPQPGGAGSSHTEGIVLQEMGCSPGEEPALARLPLVAGAPLPCWLYAPSRACCVCGRAEISVCGAAARALRRLRGAETAQLSKARVMLLACFPN